jgi:hypothetical protein
VVHVIPDNYATHKHPKVLRWLSRHPRFDLQAAINRFFADHNAEPKPFVWTADPDVILDKVTRDSSISVAALGML